MSIEAAGLQDSLWHCVNCYLWMHRQTLLSMSVTNLVARINATVISDSSQGQRSACTQSFTRRQTGYTQFLYILYVALTTSGISIFHPTLHSVTETRIFKTRIKCHYVIYPVNLRQQKAPIHRVECSNIHIFSLKETLYESETPESRREQTWIIIH